MTNSPVELSTFIDWDDLVESVANGEDARKFILDVDICMGCESFTFSLIESLLESLLEKDTLYEASLLSSCIRETFETEGEVNTETSERLLETQARIETFKKILEMLNAI
jgi:hypothetical protein